MSRSGAQLDPRPRAGVKPCLASARRRRGPRLSRRRGQAGTVMQRSRTWDPKLPCYGKFWQDVPGSPVRKRRTRNHNFVGLPIVDPTKQHRPTVTREELHGIMAAINPRYTILVALLAGT